MESKDEEIRQLSMKVQHLEKRLKDVWELYQTSKNLQETYYGMLLNLQHKEQRLFDEIDLIKPDSSFLTNNLSQNPKRSKPSIPEPSFLDRIAAVSSVNDSPDLLFAKTSFPLKTIENNDETSPDILLSKKRTNSSSAISKEEEYDIIEEVEEGKKSLDILKDEDRYEKKYQEVVLGKARQELPGHSCAECLAFYQSIGRTLHPGEDVQSIMNKYSRHRHRHAPPSTPEGYWNMWSLPEDSAPATPKFREAPVPYMKPPSKDSPSYTKTKYQQQNHSPEDPKQSWLV